MEVEGEGQYRSTCCASLLQWLSWCSFCGSESRYAQAFLEDEAGDGQGSLRRSAANASASASSPDEESQSWLPKAAELRSSSSVWTDAKSPAWTAEAPLKELKKDKMGDLVKGYPSGMTSVSKKHAVTEVFGVFVLGCRINKSLCVGISIATSDDGEFCPTCLEPYTPDNPAIWTKCNHHFHLACIYEWLERKQTCPICEREMCFEEILE